MENQDKRKIDYIFCILLTEFICGLCIICCVLAVKFFFKSTYNDFKKWYLKNALSETDINEVLEGEENIIEI